MVAHDGYARSKADEARIALSRINEMLQALTVAGVDIPAALLAEQQRLAVLVAQSLET